MAKAELWQGTSEAGELVGELIRSERNRGLLSVTLKKIGTLRPDNDDLDFYEQNLTIADMKEIIEFTNKQSNNVKEIGKFTVMASFAILSRGTYSEFRGDIYDEDGRNSYEGFTAFWDGTSEDEIYGYKEQESRALESVAFIIHDNELVD